MCILCRYTLCILCPNGFYPQLDTNTGQSLLTQNAQSEAIKPAHKELFMCILCRCTLCILCPIGFYPQLDTNYERIQSGTFLHKMHKVKQ